MRLIAIVFTFLISLSLSGQGLFDSYSTTNDNKPYELNGFIRGTYFMGKGGADLIHFPSSLTEASFQVKAGNGYQYSLFSDIRLRYGNEFDNEIVDLDLREAWIALYVSKFRFEIGKKIVKWGRTDLINPLGQISPQNMIARSPDFEDRDLASTVISGHYSPGERISFTLLVFPIYNPSVVPFNVMELPDYVSISKNGMDNSLNHSVGFGLRNDYNFRRIDASIYLFDGYNALPGVVSGGIQMPDGIITHSPVITIEESPYKLRLAGVDFETITGKFGWRGSFAWSKPYGESSYGQPLPFPEINMVAAIDFSPGSIIITAEYGIKLLTDYSEPGMNPAFPGADALEQLLLLPPDVAKEIVGLQINTFNRLFNNQIEKRYSTAGINITTTGENGRWQPDLTCLYNFTTGDLLLMPVVVFKPYDRVTIKLGLEYWYGDNGSLFSYLSDPLNSVWTGISVNF